MKKAILYLSLIPTLFWGCSGMNVDSSFDTNSKFSSFKTYSICTGDLRSESSNNGAYDNPETRELIKKAIENQIGKYYKLDDSDPDLLIGFDVALKDRKVTYRNCRADKEGGGPVCTLETNNYTEGTLVIYATDLKRDAVIWQASANGVLNDAPLKTGKLINKTVSRLFEEFPLY